MTAQLELLNAARDAVALVMGLDPSTIEESTEFAALGADSLARVAIADAIEADLAGSGRTVHIDDATLATVSTVGELADYVSAHAAAADGSAR